MELGVLGFGFEAQGFLLFRVLGVPSLGGLVVVGYGVGFVCFSHVSERIGTVSVSECISTRRITVC